jgi:hypothetical protein
MKIRIALLASATMLSFTMSAALAQGNPYPDAKPMFVVGPHLGQAPKAGGPQLPQWNGTFTDLTHATINYTMPGSNPNKTGKTTTFKIVIIPLKMVYGKTNGNMTFDPNVDKVGNGSNNTVTQDLVASPLFTASVDFVQGGTDLGQTQYIDAFQRGNFWHAISKHGGNYHAVFGTPTVLTEQTVNVSASEGSVMQNPFGANKVGTYGFGAFDGVLRGIISKFSAQINPSVLPLFLTDNIFLTSGGCCIGGYHDSEGSQPGGQTYSYSTYVTVEGSFSQDVSALSHELGEWQDDPFIDNHVNCQDNSILEVGDPLERNKNYGGFPYVVNGSTYNLQSLVWLRYFGAPANTSLHKWYSFQNDMSHVCPGQ